MAVSAGLTGPGVMAGDFNSPAGDGIFQEISERYNDSFRAVGVGFGNTAPVGLPLHRIDQIWATPELAPVTSFVVEATSDHKMVVADYLL